jgi:hypothetical protein
MVVATLKSIAERPTKAEMVAWLEHYVREFGKQIPQHAELARSATDPSEKLPTLRRRRA